MGWTKCWPEYKSLRKQCINLISTPINRYDQRPPDHGEYVGCFKSNIDLSNKYICIFRNSVKKAQKVGQTMPVHFK